MKKATPPPFRVWHDDTNAVLIHFADGSTVELSDSEARNLALALAPNRKTRVIKWTKPTVAKLRRLYVDEGRTASECAEALGTSASAVGNQVTERGFSRRPVPGHWKRRAAAEAAEFQILGSDS